MFASLLVLLSWLLNLVWPCGSILSLACTSETQLSLQQEQWKPGTALLLFIAKSRTSTILTSTFFSYEDSFWVCLVLFLFFFSILVIGKFSFLLTFLWLCSEPKQILPLQAYRKKEKIITELNYLWHTASLCQFMLLSHELDQSW